MQAPRDRSLYPAKQTSLSTTPFVVYRDPTPDETDTNQKASKNTSKTTKIKTSTSSKRTLNAGKKSDLPGKSKATKSSGRSVLNDRRYAFEEKENLDPNLHGQVVGGGNGGGGKGGSSNVVVSGAGGGGRKERGILVTKSNVVLASSSVVGKNVPAMTRSEPNLKTLIEDPSCRSRASRNDPIGENGFRKPLALSSSSSLTSASSLLKTPAQRTVRSRSAFVKRKTSDDDGRGRKMTDGSDRRRGEIDASAKDRKVLAAALTGGCVEAFAPSPLADVTQAYYGSYDSPLPLSVAFSSPLADLRGDDVLAAPEFVDRSRLDLAGLLEQAVVIEKGSAMSTMKAITAPSAGDDESGIQTTSSEHPQTKSNSPRFRSKSAASSMSDVSTSKADDFSAFDGCVPTPTASRKSRSPTTNVSTENDDESR